jgi:hypothetical protein
MKRRSYFSKQSDVKEKKQKLQGFNLEISIIFNSKIKKSFFFHLQNFSFFFKIFFFEFD